MKRVRDSFGKIRRAAAMLLVAVVALATQTAWAQGTWDNVTLVAYPVEGGTLEFDQTTGNETHLYVRPNVGYYLKGVTLSTGGYGETLNPAAIPEDAEDQETYYVVSNLNVECTVTANFHQWTDDVRVTFNKNGHGTAPDYQSLHLGDKATRPPLDPTADGYTFCGWYKDKNGIEAYDFNTVLSKSDLKYSQYNDRYNLTLYALWANASCTVSFNANGGTGEAMVAETHAGNTTYTIPECTFSKTDYDFYGWAKTASGSAIYFPGDVITLFEDMTLYAVWKQISGTFGIHWAVSKSAGSHKYDVLTLSGSGAMTDKSYASQYPWYECRDLLTTIVIGDSVTSIGKNAFNDYEGITSLTIGSGVQTIGQKAFQGLTHITTDITLPASLTSIRMDAFKEIAKETEGGISITAAEGCGLTAIDGYAFNMANASIDLNNCNSLTALSKGLIFRRVTKDVTLPSSVTSISNMAFSRYTENPFLGDHAYIAVPAGKVLSVGNDKGAIADNGKADLIAYLYNNPAKRGQNNALTLAMSNLSDWQGQTRTVTMQRTFPAGKKQTVCLPFDPSVLLDHGTVWAFTGIENGKAVMTEQTGSLQANTPYIFEADNEVTSITFSDVEINIATDPQTEDATAGFTFHGTYAQKIWEADDAAVTGGTIYGFMMKENDGQAVGQFVKARKRTSLRPFSCWLEYNGDLTGTESSPAPQRAGNRAEAVSLPDVIEIVWMGGSEIPGTTGMMDTRTGEIYEDDAWYSIYGTKLDGRPAKTGLYINNGKKVYISVE